MLPQHSFSFETLTSFDNKHWRIDWFGYLSYEDNSGERRSEPLVEVFLSSFIKSPYGNSLNYKGSTQHWKPSKVKVPVSLLRQIRLGDVWQKGHRVQIPLPNEMREHFSINVQAAETLAVGSKDSTDYVLPFERHPYHKSATQTYCEVIELNNGNLLVIPHYVLLQAYFSSSQFVFQQLFKFGLQFESLYNPEESFITTNREAFIYLSKWAHDSAAAELARLAFDDTAQQKVRNMSAIFALQKSTEQVIRPKLGFPFKGNTSLEVFGKWCTGNTGRKSFIVYDILSCSSEYPFDTLTYFRSNPGDKNPEEKIPIVEAFKNKGIQKPKVAPQNSSSVDIRSDEEPTNRIEELVIEGREGTQFKDLWSKPIEKKRISDHKTPSKHNSSTGYLEIDSAGIGEGNASSSSARVDFQLPESEYKDKFIFEQCICRLELFVQVVSQIKESPVVIDAEYRKINANSRAGTFPYSYFPKTFLANGRPSTWQFINYLNGFTETGASKYNLRKALIAQITLFNNSTLFLIETQRRIYSVPNGWAEYDFPSLFVALCQSQASLSDYQLKSLLEECCNNRGTWNKESFRPDVHIFTVKHPSNTSIVGGDYAARQVAIIEKHTGINFDKEYKN